MFKYENIVMLDSDLETLRGPCFLTDQVISFYFAYLSSSYESCEILLVSPSVSFCLANSSEDNFAQSCKLSTKRLVLFAVNDNENFGRGDDGSHWSILVYDRSMNVFVHFDSMQGVNNIPAKKLYESVKNYMGPGGVQASRSQASKKTKRDKKKSVKSVCLSTAPPAAGGGLPMFVEWEKTPSAVKWIRLWSLCVVHRKGHV